MNRPLRSRAEGIFSLASFTEDYNSFSKRRKRIKPKNKSRHNESTVVAEIPVKETVAEVTINHNSIKQEKLSAKTKHFLKLQEQGLYSEFTDCDWLEYFAQKASEHGIKYRFSNYPRERQVMSGLIKNYTHEETKLMVDFLWDCKHEMFLGRVVGVYLLSQAFGAQNDVYQNALLWKDGKFKTLRQIKKDLDKGNQRNRNWIPQEEDKPKGVTIRI